MVANRKVAAEARRQTLPVRDAGKAGVFTLGHARSCEEGGAGGFTLIELLVVIAVIGILAAVGVPALKGMGASNDISAATRQLLDDLAYARAKAINERTTVYVVFVSDAILKADQLIGRSLTQAERREIAQHANLQYSSYALYSGRTLGDQPGPGTRRYITDWRTMPEGTFILTNKFDSTIPPGSRGIVPLFFRPLPHATGVNQFPAPFPFPTASSPLTVPLPYIGFDYQGRLYQNGLPAAEDVILPITKGSIAYPQEDKAKIQAGSLESPEVIETPRGNSTNNPSIRIDWLTGRARMVRPEKMNYAALQ